MAYDDPMSSYARPLWDYHTPGISELKTNIHDFGAQFAGLWGASMRFRNISGSSKQHIFLSPDNVVWGDWPHGDVIPYVAQYAYNFIWTLTNTSTLFVNGLGEVHVKVRGQGSESGLLLATPGRAVFAGKYYFLTSAQATPQSTDARVATVDLILVNPDVNGGLQFNSSITGVGGYEEVTIGGTLRNISDTPPTVENGDDLVYEVLIPSNTDAVDGVGSIELYYNDGSGTSISSQGIVDANGAAPNSWNASAFQRGVWHERRFQLDGVSGNEVSEIRLVDRSGVVGSHTAVYRRIRYERAGAVYHYYFNEGPTWGLPPFYPSQYSSQAISNADPGIVGPANSMMVRVFNPLAAYAPVSTPTTWQITGV